MRILRRRDLRAKTGLSAMTIDRYEAAGNFPRRVQIGLKAIGWVEAEVDDWLAERVAQRDQASEQTAAA